MKHNTPPPTYLTQPDAHRTGGQALVVLLFYVVVALTLVLTSVAVNISSSLGTMQEEVGNHALETAESGAENALLRLLRTPNYIGEVLTVNGGNATVTVEGEATKTITSVGVVGAFSRTVQAVAVIENGILTLVTWREL